jgi:hypothetical protein
MGIGITPAIGCGTADFVGGVGARRASTMSLVFSGEVTGQAAETHAPRYCGLDKRLDTASGRSHPC